MEISFGQNLSACRNLPKQDRILSHPLGFYLSCCEKPSLGSHMAASMGLMIFRGLGCNVPTANFQKFQTAGTTAPFKKVAGCVHIFLDKMCAAPSLVWIIPEGFHKSYSIGRNLDSWGLSLYTIYWGLPKNSVTVSHHYFTGWTRWAPTKNHMEL